MKSTFNTPFIQDADLRLEGSLPNAAGGTVILAYLDLGAFVASNSGTRQFLGTLGCWIDGVPPSVAPDTSTLTLSIEAAADTLFTTPRLLGSQTFTASNGTGLGEQHVRASLPSDCPQYIRFKATSGAGMLDVSAYSFSGALFCPVVRR